ncbi:L,D-transpeptidase family protein [Luteolibacter sp. AS25]|uniref:L,D-transpeptidase family protein n=1 Tax=Luteolibacter sp. AS25 TaxID=3135776 RepID=UPI00398B9354
MNSRFPLLILTIFTLAACGGEANGQKRAKEVESRISQPLTERLKEKTLELGSPIFIRAFKEELELELFVRNSKTGKFELFETYPIARSSGKLGPKLAEGDRQVPEGFYYVPPSAMNPNSTYHLSFNIGYPNSFDRAHNRTGSLIMIHGSNVSIGCLAMTDPVIEEIYTLATAAHKNGQSYFRVHIFPFRMNGERMRKAAASPHLQFWENLKAGYDHFENSKVPPEVSVENRTYTFK